MGEPLSGSTISTRADATRIFRALHSFSGLSRPSVIAIGSVLIVAVGLVEWASDLPFSLDVAYALVVGAVTFHGSAAGGVFTTFLSGLSLSISHGAPRSGSGSWANAGGEATALIALLLGLVLILHALYRALDELQHQARRDSLTGILNQRGFMEAAERERRRSLRDETPLTIAFIDIDRLKELNDQSGHEAGDQLILSFVSAASESIRAYDILARIGGDEFVLLLPATDQQMTLSVIGRLHRALDRQEVVPSVSIGAITYLTPGDELSVMLRDADRLMYLGKERGGGSLVGEVRSAQPVGDQIVVELKDLVAG